MGFEVATRSKVELPSDLPGAQDAAGSHPDGAIYRAEDGRRFRLRHARWVPVVARKRGSNGKAAATK